MCPGHTVQMTRTSERLSGPANLLESVLGDRKASQKDLRATRAPCDTLHLANVPTGGDCTCCRRASVAGQTARPISSLVMIRAGIDNGQ